MTQITDEQKKAETPQQRAERLSFELDKAERNTYTKGDVKTLLNSIASISPARSGNTPLNDEAIDGTCRAPGPASRVQRGDVFIAHGIGGKVRPWVILRVNGDVVTATALSSGESAPGLVQSKCRFWGNAWIGATVAQFPLETAKRELMRPFTAKKQLDELEERVISMLRPAKPKTMAEIAAIRRVK